VDPKAGNESKRTFTEEIEVASAQLVERIKQLYEEGRVRRVRIKSADGGVILELPLSIGAIAGGAVALAAPWLALIAAFAGVVANAKVEILREEPAKPEQVDPTGRE
jgi:hypothetical protein